MKKRFKILYMSFSGKWVGGGQKGLLYMLERIDRKDFEPIVAVPSGGLFLDKVSELGVQTVGVGMGRLNILNLITATLGILRVIRRHGIDLIHTDSPRNTVYGGIAARITGTPLVYHARVSDRDRLDKVLHLLATRVVAVSEAAAGRFRDCSPTQTGQFVSARKVEIIYNAIDTNEFSPNVDGRKTRKEFGISNILIGTVGQLIPAKGQRELLFAAADILRIHPEVRFVIVGTGEAAYREELESICRRLNIADNVILTGFREDIPAIMAAFDVFVLFTSNEGLCRTVLEAMGSEKPVITTDVGGNPETVIDGITGILLSLRDPSRFKDAILELVEDEKKRKTMGRRGREVAMERFDMDRNMRRVERLYRLLLSSKRKSAVRTQGNEESDA
jgi:glycosyltransferase involved in cell wall biosynthesis